MLKQRALTSGCAVYVCQNTVRRHRCKLILEASVGSKKVRQLFQNAGKPAGKHGHKHLLRRSRALSVATVAMVNVDFASPSLVLGSVLIGSGMLLLQLRNVQNKAARDADIVVAAMVSIVGSTLVFQGWRLDPLLLLCQALTTAVAFYYGLETFKLRNERLQDQQPPGMLPPPPAQEQTNSSSSMYGWPGTQYAQQQQPQQPASFSQQPQPQQQSNNYLPPSQSPQYPWPPADPYQATWGQPGNVASQYDETIKYDYYGNPIMPADPPQSYNSFTSDQYGQSAYDSIPAYAPPAFAGQPVSYSDPANGFASSYQNAPFESSRDSVGAATQPSTTGTSQPTTYAGSGTGLQAVEQSGSKKLDNQSRKADSPAPPYQRPDIYGVIDDWE